jgi:hypothetical protein
LALLLKRLFIPHLTCIPITLIFLYIFTNKQFAWNVSHIFQDCLLMHVPESFNPESHHFIPLFNKVCYTQWPCH